MVVVVGVCGKVFWSGLGEEEWRQGRLWVMCWWEVGRGREERRRTDIVSKKHSAASRLFHDRSHSKKPAHQRRPIRTSCCRLICASLSISDFAYPSRPRTGRSWAPLWVGMDPSGGGEEEGRKGGGRSPKFDNLAPGKVFTALVYRG